MRLTDTLIWDRLTGTVTGSKLRQLLLTPPVGEKYWRIIPWIHKRRRHLSPRYVDPPIDPFELFLVDPDQITRFSGRQFPPWQTRWRDFGSVLDGDWDQRRLPPINPDYKGIDPSLYLAERFSETHLHKGLVEHFVNGVPWGDLGFVNKLMQRSQSMDRPVWQDCRTRTEIRQYCHELDRLYRDMHNRGCLPIRELNKDEDRCMTFREVMKNEILVDVTRTGELVFVAGRHRLSLAKILNLDRVPVAVVVRHPRWLARNGDDTSFDSAPMNGRQFEPEAVIGEPLHVSW